MRKHHYKPNLRATARSDARNPTRSRLANERFAEDYFQEQLDSIPEEINRILNAIAARRPGGSIYG